MEPRRGSLKAWKKRIFDNTEQNGSKCNQGPRQSTPLHAPQGWICEYYATDLWLIIARLLVASFWRALPSGNTTRESLLNSELKPKSSKHHISSQGLKLIDYCLSNKSNDTDTINSHSSCTRDRNDLYNTALVLLYCGLSERWHRPHWSQSVYDLKGSHTHS